MLKVYIHKTGSLYPKTGNLACLEALSLLLQIYFGICVFGVTGRIVVKNVAALFQNVLNQLGLLQTQVLQQ